MSIEFEIKESQKIKNVYIVKPTISIDKRGFIWSSFQIDELQHVFPQKLTFKHDKFSFSNYNVLRGIHGDSKTWKLVTCVYGEIVQVVVDLRKESGTYLQWEKYFLKMEEPTLILVPPNMGNAFYVQSQGGAIYHYKLAYDGDYFDTNDQFSVKWNDAQIAIQWPTDSPILSERDE